MSIYDAFDNAELTAELTRLKTARTALATKFQASDLTVEKDLNRIDAQLRELIAAISERDDLQDLIHGEPGNNTAVASFA